MDALQIERFYDKRQNSTKRGKKKNNSCIYNIGKMQNNMQPAEIPAQHDEMAQQSRGQNGATKSVHALFAWQCTNESKANRAGTRKLFPVFGNCGRAPGKTESLVYLKRDRGSVFKPG